MNNIKKTSDNGIQAGSRLDLTGIAGKLSRTGTANGQQPNSGTRTSFVPHAILMAVLLAVATPSPAHAGGAAKFLWDYLLGKAIDKAVEGITPEGPNIPPPSDQPTAGQSGHNDNGGAGGANGGISEGPRPDITPRPPPSDCLPPGYDSRTECQK